MQVIPGYAAHGKRNYPDKTSYAVQFVHHKVAHGKLRKGKLRTFFMCGGRPFLHRAVKLRLTYGHKLDLRIFKALFNGFARNDDLARHKRPCERIRYGGMHIHIEQLVLQAHRMASRIDGCRRSRFSPGRNV